MAIHERYRLEGRAYMERIPSAVKIIRRPGGMQAVPMSGSVDWCGALSGGRAVFIEQKRTAEVSLPLMRHGDDTVSPKQADTLAHVAHMGGLGLVLVECRDGWAVLTVDEWMDAIEWASEAGRKSVPLDIMQRIGAPARDGDWLSAIEARE